MAKFLVDLVGRLGTLDRHQAVDAGAYSLLCLVKFLGVGSEVGHLDLVAQIVLHGVGHNEVSVGQTLHECRCTETVGTVVGEVALADGEETLDRGLELIVHPDAAHGVVGSGEDHHRGLIGVVVRDHLVHIEEVAVAVAHDILAQALDGIFEVEIYGIAGTYAKACVAALLGCTAGDVAGTEVTEGRIATLQIEVAVLVGDIGRFLLAGADSLGVFFLLGHPDAAVVTQRLAHEGELRLVFAVYGDTGGVDLSEREVGKISTLLESLHCSRAVAAHGVGGEEEGTAITAGGEHHGVGGVTLYLTCDEVAHDDTAGTAVDDNHVEHLATVERLHGALLDLAVQRSIGTEEELLAGLTLGVECTRHLCATKRAVGKQAAVFAGERHTLCHALVNDIV